MSEPNVHRDTNAPTCPHCDHVMSTDEMVKHDGDLFAMAPKEEDAVATCPACSETYHLRGGYVPFYVSAINEDDL